MLRALCGNILVFFVLQAWQLQMSVFNRNRGMKIGQLLFEVLRYKVKSYHPKLKQNRNRNTGEYSVKIIIIEDEPIIRKELKILLENALYNVILIEKFDHVVNQVLQTQADLVLLDLNLPGISGIDICTQIREKSEVPIIFLTSRTSSMDELSGMLKGGDDYITKPYQAPLLLARISAVLKRTNPSGIKETSTLNVNGVSLSLAQGSIGYEDKKAELTKNELKILHFLFLHPGEIVPRLDLIEYLWDNHVFIDDNTLSVNMTRIREKLKSIGVEDFIETKRGMGYRI